MTSAQCSRAPIIDDDIRAVRTYAARTGHGFPIAYAAAHPDLVQAFADHRARHSRTPSIARPKLLVISADRFEAGETSPHTVCVPVHDEMIMPDVRP